MSDARPKLTKPQQEALFLAISNGELRVGPAHLVKYVTAKNLVKRGYLKCRDGYLARFEITPDGRAVAKLYEATP